MMGSSLLDSVEQPKVKDRWNAFVAYPVLQPTSVGRLDGYQFAVKDVFHISGYTNGAGNPDWLRTHTPADQHAQSIHLLLREGAKMIGTTHTDELMFSLNGENAHYGTPVNPAAPAHIPGGSSSGSASAVAAGMVDFTLGTDTGGSVRVPSAYCGIYGFRPTQGAVSIEGVIPLATSFDTVGWMARDARTMLKVGMTLLEGACTEVGCFNHVYYSKEAWELVDPECYEQMINKAHSLVETVPNRSWVGLTEEGLGAWMSAFRILQGLDIWASHGEWIRQENPSFGPGVSDRFEWTSTLVEEDGEASRLVREAARNQLSELLGDNGLLVIPTTPSIAPMLNQSGSELENRRQQTLQLTSIAGLSGFPQITIPAGTLKGAPCGVSLLAGRGQDLKLLQYVASLME